MRVRPTVLVLLCACTAASAENDIAASWAALRAGGAVALVRHTNADNGPAVPPAVIRVDDCSTQRNLTDRGRAEARRLGDQFRTERIPVAKLLTSDACHCHQTATLLGLAAPEAAPPFRAFMVQERIREVTEQLATWLLRGADPARSW
jgi:broad specificity phosphatase PhoE